MIIFYRYTMITDKAYSLLVIQSLLLAKGSFTRPEVLKWTPLSPISFRRYMRVYRDYLERVFPEWSLRYDRKNDLYHLKNDRLGKISFPALAHELLKEVGRASEVKLSQQ
jgi:hypothetical protein